MKTKLRRLMAVMAILFLMVQSEIIAETIALRNGQIISAVVVDQKQNTVTVKLPDGNLKTYKKSEIIKISFKSVKEVQKEISQAVKEPKEKIAEFTEPIIEKETPEISRNRAFLYSALLPGLGQYQQKRKKPAYFWFGGFVAMTAAAIHYRGEYIAKRKIYDQSVSESFLYPFAITGAGLVTTQESGWLLASWQKKMLSTKENMRQASVNADRATGLLLAFYLLNLTDVFVFHPASNQTISLGMNEPVYNETKGVRFAWTVHF